MNRGEVMVIDAKWRFMFRRGIVVARRKMARKKGQMWIPLNKGDK